MQKQGKIRGYVPVIAVTANARSEQIATARDSGMASRLANALIDATDYSTEDKLTRKCRMAWLPNHFAYLN